METSPPTNGNNNGNGSALNRERLARLISVFVLSSSGILTIVAMVAALRMNDPWPAIKDIFTIMLPLWGTWVGTIIAFYFSKENFEAANKSMKELVSTVTSDQKLKSINAKDVMRPLASIKPFIVVSPEVLDNTLLTDILAQMETDKVSRLPFVNEKNVVLYCLHKSTFHDFIASQAINGSADVRSMNFGQMRTSPAIARYINGGASFVKENASLLDVKVVMDQNPACLDVFITASGSATEPILGWITNDKLLENSRV